jgi:decaprenyl-diphosphate synthase subunit 1
MESLGSITHTNINKKKNRENILLNSQRQIALIAEMIHVSSLIHDDIIDNSDLRRGKPSINSQWGCNKAVMAGDYVMAIGSRTLAKLGNTRVVETLSLVLEDLVKGELMQFGTKESENERFEHYTMKTYRKTASLIANSCKAIAILLIDNHKSIALTKDYELIQMAYECGKNIGIAFQLIDDVLDFTSHSDKLGKPGTDVYKKWHDVVLQYRTAFISTMPWGPAQRGYAYGKTFRYSE